MSTKYYISTIPVGGSGGNSFDNLQSINNPIVAFSAWSNDAAILALRIVYADGTAYEVGNQRSNETTISFAPGEQVTSLSMMETDGSTTGGHQCVGQITFKTTLESVTMGPGGTYASNVDVASGLMIGINGGCGDAVDRLSFYCLRPVKSVMISVNVNDDAYKAIVAKIVGSQQDLEQVDIAFQNFGPAPKATPWSFNGSRNKTNTNTFTQSSTKTFGDSVAIEISGEFFGIGGKTTDTFKWEVSSTTTKTASTATAVTIGETISGTVDAGYVIRAYTSCELGTLSLPYSSTVVVTFQDPSIPTEQYVENGVFDNTTYSIGTTTWEIIFTPPTPPAPPVTSN